MSPCLYLLPHLLCFLRNYIRVYISGVYEAWCKGPQKAKAKAAAQTSLSFASLVVVAVVVVSVEVLSAHYKFTGIQFIVAAIKKVEEAAEKVAKRSQNVVVSVGYQICRVWLWTVNKQKKKKKKQNTKL